MRFEPFRVLDRAIGARSQAHLSGRGSDRAFDILRRASQRTNRKLRDIAADTVRAAEPEPDPR